MAHGGGGYDGVLLYAPHNVYGGADALKRLVDGAHQRGIMVFLDVVYNHFGPDGNYLSLYAPDFFHPERHTPWGAAIAFEKPEVRTFFIENALYWLEEFRSTGYGWTPLIRSMIRRTSRYLKLWLGACVLRFRAVTSISRQKTTAISSGCTGGIRMADRVSTPRNGTTTFIMSRMSSPLETPKAIIRITARTLPPSSRAR